MRPRLTLPAILLLACGGSAGAPPVAPSPAPAGDAAAPPMSPAGMERAPDSAVVVLADGGTPPPPVPGDAAVVAGDAAVAAEDAGGPPPAPGELPLAAVKAARAQAIASVPTQVEGPSWKGGDLFFAADGGGYGLMRLSADGKLFRYHPTLQPIGSYLLADGSMLVCDHALLLVQVFADGKVAQLQADFEGKPIENCNDVTVDGSGNLFLSARHTGFIYRLTPAGEVTRVAGGMGLTNGVEVDPESKFVYFAAGGTLYRVALGGATFGDPEMLMGVNADGMVFDAWGNLWMAVFPTGLRVYDPKAKQTVAMVGTGGTPTNLTFGGPAGDTLYVTNGGKGIAKVGPIPGLRGSMHPGAPKYAIKKMLDLVPADTPK